MKQTAVDWLKASVELMIKNGGCEDLLSVLVHIEQAKAMEKKQIVKFSKVVLKEYKWIRPEELSTIKRLYNKTFNTNER
jgi:hypothetical protein